MASLFNFTDDEGQEGGVDATGTPTTSGSIDSLRLLNAIKRTETGGDYSAKGSSGERGAYQFMPATWKQFSNEANNKKGALEQTPENEEKVAAYKIKQWIDKGLSVEEIAAKWNSGSEKGWEKKKGTNKHGVKYDVPAYVKKVADAYSIDPDKEACLLYTSPSPRDQRGSRMPSSA